MSSFVTCIEKRYTGGNGRGLKMLWEWWWPRDCMDVFMPLSCPLQNGQSQKPHPSYKNCNRKRNLMWSLPVKATLRTEIVQVSLCHVFILIWVHPTNYGSNLFRNQLYPQGKRSVLFLSTLPHMKWIIDVVWISYSDQYESEYNWVNEKDAFISMQTLPPC